MKIAACNVCFRKMTFDRCVSDVSSIGFRAMEVWMSPQHFSIDSTYQEVKAIERLFNKTNMKIIALTPPSSCGNTVNLCSVNESQKRRNLVAIKQIANIARYLGVGLIQIAPGWTYSDVPLAQHKQALVEMLIKIIDETDDVVFSLEALQKREVELINTTEQLSSLCKRVDSDRLAMTLDIGAVAASSEDFAEVLSTHANKVAHIHMGDVMTKDNTVRATHLPFGSGTRNIASDLKTIQASDFEGYAVCEFVDQTWYNAPTLAYEKGYTRAMEILCEK